MGEQKKIEFFHPRQDFFRSSERQKLWAKQINCRQILFAQAKLLTRTKDELLGGNSFHQENFVASALSFFTQVNKERGISATKVWTCEGFMLLDMTAISILYTEISRPA